MTERHRFILQAWHPDYACPAFETMFAVEQLEDLQALLGPDAQDDPEIRKLYWLESADLAAISQRFGVSFEAGDRDVCLCRWQSLREPPYLVHTGYELPLMLDGRKKASCTKKSMSSRSASRIAIPTDASSKACARLGTRRRVRSGGFRLFD